MIRALNRAVRPVGLVATTLATTMLGGCGLWGYELVVRDIGVALEYVPASFDYSLSGGGINSSGSDGFDAGYGVAFRGLYSFTKAGQRHGPVAEIGLGFATYTYESSASMFAFGGTIAGGYGFALLDRWDLHGLLRVGLGVTTLDFDDSEAFGAFSAKGAYLSYGLVGGASYRITDRWIARAELGYALTSTALDGDGDVEIELDLTTVSFALALYWRATNTPWRLD